ncbi:MAG: hypothetical protein R2789_17975 [Microthrixaceae bacterium]
MARIESLSHRRLLLATAALCVTSLLGVACSESAEPSDTTERDLAADNADRLSRNGSVEPTEGDGTTVLSRFPDAIWFEGEVPEPVAADDSLPPVKVGFMNVDSAPVGAMPELHTATDGFEKFVNAELGGIDGHPMEIVPCLLGNALAPEEAAKAQAGGRRRRRSARRNRPLNGAALILEENGIPWVGGIPVNNDEMVSPVSFQFSGGSPGRSPLSHTRRLRSTATRRWPCSICGVPGDRDVSFCGTAPTSPRPPARRSTG